MINNIVIIGAGPAGISSAIQLKHYNVEPVLLEKKQIGGLLINANMVENYPGFPEGISGKQLVKLFREQLENAGVKVKYEEVLKLDYQNGLFMIKTDKRTYSSSIVIIASGTKPYKLNLEISKEVEKYVFYEIYNLDNVVNKKIAIIGAGDAAFDYALSLSRKNKVFILNRGEEVKCLHLLWQKAVKNENIHYFEGTKLKDIKYNSNNLILRCENYPDGNEFEMDVSYLVIAIGRKPCCDFLSENIKSNLEKLQEKKILYIIGDVKNKLFRQTAIAVGDGIKSAMEAYKKLKGDVK